MPDHMRSYLDFEKPVAELDAKIDELRALAASGSDIGEEISRMEDKAAQALNDLYANLTPWQKNAGGASSAAAASDRFYQCADLGIHAAGGRSKVRRGRSTGRRLRPLPWREHLCENQKNKNSCHIKKIKKKRK